jgi:hypothetical protein
VESDARPDQLIISTRFLRESLLIKYPDLPSAARNQTGTFQLPGSIRDGLPLDTQHFGEQVQRRARSAGITTRVGNHTFRATGVTAYLKNGGTLEKAAQMANHASTCTTQFYDRRAEEADPVLLPGYRKIVRKWNEEIMRFRITVRVKSRTACGNQAGAESAYREFAEWMKRPDRKEFDKIG